MKQQLFAAAPRLSFSPPIFGRKTAQKCGKHDDSSIKTAQKHPRCRPISPTPVVFNTPMRGSEWKASFIHQREQIQLQPGGCPNFGHRSLGLSRKSSERARRRSLESLVHVIHQFRTYGCEKAKSLPLFGRARNSGISTWSPEFRASQKGAHEKSRGHVRRSN